MGDTAYTYSTIGNGSKVTASAGTAVQLTATATACRLVRIKAHPENSNTVVIGASTVVAAADSTRKGIALSPGEMVDIRIDDLSKLYLDSLVSAEGIGYVYFN